MNIIWTNGAHDACRLTFPIAKTEKLPDGRLMVEGVATSEALDSDNEIIDYESAKAAFSAWRGNIREQHDPKKAVGKAVEVSCDDALKQITLKAFISAGAPDTQAKVLDGTLTCYSIGAGVAKRTTEKAAKADGSTVDAKRVFLSKMSETSVVDSGANPDSAISIVKAEGAGDALALGDAVDAGEVVQKSLWTARTLLDALGSVRSALADADFEVQCGQHPPEVAAEIKAALQALGEVAQKYLSAEVANMTKAEGGGDVAKAGARFSRATKDALKAAHDACKAADSALSKLGYADAEEVEDEAGKAAGADDEVQKAARATEVAEVAEIAKAAGLTVEEGALAPALTKAAIVELLAVRKRVAELEALPAAPRGYAKAVAIDKATDRGGDKPAEVEPVTKTDGTVDEVTTLIKSAQTRPIPIS